MALIARELNGQADAPKSACAVPDRMVEWLKVLCLGQLGLVEMRAINVARHSTSSRHTESVMYSSDEFRLAALVRDARAISPRAEGVYITLNPIMTVVGNGSATDKHIALRRWLLIDVDPVRPAGVSATDAEKAEAKKVIAAVEIWLASLGWPNPIEADSGNGYHLLYRIELPNDEAAATLIKRVLEVVASQVNTAFAKVDCSVYNASRICKLYGTIARKGEPTEERPHRTSAILDYPRTGLEVVTAEQLAAVCGLSVVGPKPGINGHGNGIKPKLRGIIARDLGDDPKEAYCTKALEEELRELATTGQGNRNNQLLKSAAALFELVGPDQLDQVEVEQRLRTTAQQIGLEPREIERTLQSARDRARPRSLEHVGKATKAAVILDPLTGVKEYVDDPHRLAREFLKAEHHHADGPTIRAWNEEWHVWRNGFWQPKSDREINASLTRFVKREFDKHAQASKKEAKGVGTRLIGNVALALRSLVIIPMHDLPEQPAWIDVDGPDPNECLATRSGILHLPTLDLQPLTPRFFSPNVLGYSFDKNAPKPEAWYQFLTSVWPSDQDSIDCLQEWFGYLLTTDTRQQKILMLIGPKRSGKGTIANTIKVLVGEANVAAPTLSSLGGRFGSQPLIGKTVAICTESRITGRADSQAIVERLLSISGEDPQSIERKSIGNWSGALHTRFVLQGNELPRLGDYSSALPSRLILLKMEHSFLGREDRDLAAKIRDELPGILWWSIAGWERLRGRGHFLQPSTGAEMLKEFEELNNPVGAFIAEKCEMAPDFKVAIPDLYRAWCSWCKDGGREHPGDQQGFGRNIRTVLPKIEVCRLGGRGDRVRFFRGLRLIDDFNAD